MSHELSVSASAAHFIYKPLADRDEIRLLRLHPRSASAAIRCTIEHVEFKKVPEYEALSYIWGSPDITGDIQLNGSDFRVRKNLWSALDSLRLENETRVLWIDAICIDQDNIDERNSQVSQMGALYQSASRVVVWLGDSDQTSKLTFQVLSLLLKWTEILKPLQSLTQTQKDQLQSILKLFGRPYWTRLWIIQEFLMAKRHDFQCGQDRGSGTQFWLFLWTAECQGNPSHFSKSIADNYKPVWNLLKERKMFRKFRSANLIDLIDKLQLTECEKQLDRIFALRSLSLECCQEAVPVDYSQPWMTHFLALLDHQNLHEELIAENSIFALYRRIQYEREISPDCPAAQLQVLSTFLSPKRRRNWRPNPSDTRLIDIRCRLRGRICHASSLMPYDHYPSQFSGTHFLTAAGWQQLDFIARKLMLEKEGRLRNILATDLDLVGHCGHYPNIKVRMEGLEPTPIWNTKDSTYILQGGGEQGVENFLDVWNSARKHLLENRNQFDQIQLVVEENGLVFFAPKHAKVGDIVLQYPRSDVIGIAHFDEFQTDIRDIHDIRSSQKFKLTKLMRGVNLLCQPHGAATDVVGKLYNMFDYYFVCNGRFQIDSDTLRNLTKASPTTSDRAKAW